MAIGPKWQERQSVLVETLRAVDPDVVALQEVWGTDGTAQAHEFAPILACMPDLPSRPTRLFPIHRTFPIMMA